MFGLPETTCERASQAREGQVKLLVSLWDWAEQDRARRCLRASQCKHRTPCSMTEDTGLLWQRQSEAEQGVGKGPSKCHLSLITPGAPSKG